MFKLTTSADDCFIVLYTKFNIKDHIAHLSGAILITIVTWFNIKYNDIDFFFSRALLRSIREIRMKVFNERRYY